jgi:glycosyltransferase involved in cell wall biosynthesis
LPSWGEDFLLQDPPDVVALPGAGFRVLFAGNVGEAQGLDTLVKAASVAKERGAAIDWIVVGSGRALPDLQSSIAESGVEDVVHLIGRRPLDEMPLYLGAADALYVGLRGGGSVGATIPSKVQAYLAAGRPILAALTGEAVELIERSGAGIAVRPDSAVALAEAAITLSELTDEELAAMRSAGRACYRQHFTQKGIVDELLQHVAQIVALR